MTIQDQSHRTVRMARDAQKEQVVIENLLSEKKDLLNLPSVESKGGFVGKLRRLLSLEKRLSRKKNRSFPDL